MAVLELLDPLKLISRKILVTNNSENFSLCTSTVFSWFFFTIFFLIFQDTMGWGENDRGVSFTFGAEVAAKFLHKHDFDLICRAHQVVEDGYEFFAKRQLVTLFSAPNYCGEFDNAGAMMSVDETLMCSFQILKVRNLQIFSFFSWFEECGNKYVFGAFFIEAKASIFQVRALVKLKARTKIRTIGPWLDCTVVDIMSRITQGSDIFSRNYNILREIDWSNNREPFSWNHHYVNYQWFKTESMLHAVWIFFREITT